MFSYFLLSVGRADEKLGCKAPASYYLKSVNKSTASETEFHAVSASACMETEMFSLKRLFIPVEESAPVLWLVHSETSFHDKRCRWIDPGSCPSGALL